MTENTQNSMELYVQAYSIAIVLASRPLYGLYDVDILDKSVFVGDIVDKIQEKLDTYTDGRNCDLTINKSLFEICPTKSAPPCFCS